MDALSVFVTTSLLKAGAQVAAEFATYCICNSSSSKPNFIDDEEVSRIGRGLRSSVCVWSAIHVSRADVFRHVWQWFMKR